MPRIRIVTTQQTAVGDLPVGPGHTVLEGHCASPAAATWLRRYLRHDALRLEIIDRPARRDRDALLRLDGIGPEIAAALEAHGITTPQALLVVVDSATDRAELAAAIPGVTERMLLTWAEAIDPARAPTKPTPRRPRRKKATP